MKWQNSMRYNTTFILVVSSLFLIKCYQGIPFFTYFIYPQLTLRQLIQQQPDLESQFINRFQLGPSISQAPVLVLDYRWSYNLPTYRRTVTPHWYKTHSISIFGLLSSWITGACHYIRQRFRSAKGSVRAITISRDNR